MHKGLYWSQLITGIGIGLIIAALIWIYVPKFFPGVEDHLNQLAGIEEVDQVSSSVGIEPTTPLNNKGEYSHLFAEDNPTQGTNSQNPSTADDPQGVTKKGTENPAPEPVQSNEQQTAEGTTGIISESTTSESESASAQKEFGVELDASEATQQSEVEVSHEPAPSKDLVAPVAKAEQVSATVNNQVDAALETEQQPQQLEESQTGELATSQPEPTISQPDVTETGSSNQEVEKTTQVEDSEPEIVTLADLKVYEVEIEYGDTAKDIAKKLEQFGLAHRKDFLKMISLQNLERKLKVGRYYIKHGTSLVDLIDELTTN